MPPETLKTLDLYFICHDLWPPINWKRAILHLFKKIRNDKSVNVDGLKNLLRNVQYIDDMNL